MDLTHIHLLLNHFPVIGTIIALGLFLLALLGKSDHLERTSLVLFLGLALLTLPVYVSGNAAAEAICDGTDHPNWLGRGATVVESSDAFPSSQPCQNPAVSRALIHKHEGAAFLGVAFMDLTGAFAWLGLWQIRRNSKLPRGTAAAVLLLSLVTVGLMANASNMGGDIRHPEIRSTAETPAAEGEPLARVVGSWVSDHTFVWPTCETLHFVGLCLLFGVATVIDLRVLGVIKGIPFATLHRLLPWAILAFGVNTVTGMLFFVASPWQYTANGTFHWKIILMLVAGLNVVYFTLFDEPWHLKEGQDATVAAKFVAASAFALVLGVMYCGRMLPFLGNSF